MSNTQSINSGENILLFDAIFAPTGVPAFDIAGDNARLNILRSGSVTAADEGNTAIVSSGNEVVVSNAGDITGTFNGVVTTGDDFTLRNNFSGTITSDSRAVDLTDGDGIRVFNSGDILGTGDQRNGTVYVDGTVDDLTLINLRNGTIDAGAGNSGDGFSVQVGEGEDLSSDNFKIVNLGTIAGRGEAEFAPEEGRLTANGSSGVRFVSGAEVETTITGSFNNTGTISAEVTVGFLGGFVVEDGVAYRGTIRNSGTITAPQNGLYLGDAEHQLQIFNQSRGLIESGSRAVNLDGDNILLRNSGEILGTGDQRNGTIYVDGTGDNITINNLRTGIVDAGEGNSGSGVSVQVGTTGGLSDGSDDLETSVDIFNSGSIEGRGTENVPAGVRLFVGSGLIESTFTGDIVNNRGGVIASAEDAGISIEEGVIFNGRILNNGVITGGNGLAINAAGALGNIELVNTGFGSLEGAVILGEGDDTFVNNARNSSPLIINAGRGNDVITGGGGVNTYQFSTNSGRDRITDFQVDRDILDLTPFFSNVEEVLGVSEQIGNDVAIDLGVEDSLTLADVEIGSLTADNFTFA